MRTVITSPTWRAVTQTSNELRRLPTRLMREAGLEDSLKEIRDSTQSITPPNLGADLGQWQKDISPWTTPPAVKIDNSPTNSPLPEDISGTDPELSTTSETDELKG
jgi:hypothetical protein